MSSRPSAECRSRDSACAVHLAVIASRAPTSSRIADWIKPGSNVLDLGCGDGALLAHLYEAKRCRGYGVEIDDAEVLACAGAASTSSSRTSRKGSEMFRGGRFDVVVLSMAIQATHRTEKVLREMSEVAAEGIVSFPNFGHWFHIWSILLGRMPVTREMPYQWYDTPNLHLTTIQDFEICCPTEPEDRRCGCSSTKAGGQGLRRQTRHPGDLPVPAALITPASTARQ